jgi:hypothetical protein
MQTVLVVGTLLYMYQSSPECKITEGKKHNEKKKRNKDNSYIYKNAGRNGNESKFEKI